MGSFSSLLVEKPPREDLKPKEIFKGLKDYSELRKYMGSIYAKNERILRLEPFIK